MKLPFKFLLISLVPW